MTDRITEDEIKAPHIIIAAGPNGSGKSTIVNKHFLENPASGFQGEYINADEIAKTLEKQIPDYIERNIHAAGIAEQRRIEAIQAGKSFAFETVMSTPEKVALITQAQANGYEVSLIFVSTDDPEKNIQRVANRVALGGHAVQVDAIRNRYHSAMNLLACAVDHADYALIIDNSSDKPRDVASKQDRQLVLHNEEYAPRWVTEKLVHPYQERQFSRQILNTIFSNAADNDREPLPSLCEADASNGKIYTGKIADVTNYHVLQVVDARMYILHDRMLMATKDIQPEKNITIEYAYDKGKIRETVTPLPHLTKKSRLCRM